MKKFTAIAAALVATVGFTAVSAEARCVRATPPANIKVGMKRTSFDKEFAVGVSYFTNRPGWMHLVPKKGGKKATYFIYMKCTR